MVGVALGEEMLKEAHVLQAKERYLVMRLRRMLADYTIDFHVKATACIPGVQSAVPRDIRTLTLS